METQPIRFVRRGAVVTVSDVAPTRTVLDYLREDTRCTGTKEGCAEGDCGACTVVVAELADRARATGTPSAEATVIDGLSLRTVNACIQFLPALDGKALFTVEDLKQLAGGTLHPTQQAMVECHGSQCGFCTPGFVMSLWSTYERHCAHGTRPTRQQLADELSGNLCRCTGYRPILDAGQRMFDLPAVKFDPTATVQALQSIRRRETFVYEGPDAAAPTPAGPRRDRFFAPRTLQALADLRQAHPQARLLAGSTDVGLWVTKQFRDLGDILYIGEVDELKRIERRDAELWIGAGATLEDAYAALTAAFPALQDLWLRFASPPVRNAGTMGGNVANGSPIGDSAPALIALGAQIVLRQGERVRTLLLEDFYLDYMKNALEPGEFVQGLRVPLPAPTGSAQRQVRAYKISKRFDSDISAVCGCFSLELAGDGRVGAVRLAYGGMAATVRRAAAAEAALASRAWNEDSVRAAMRALREDFKPLTDMRASDTYRMQVAQNLLYRFWLETRTDQPLTAEQVSVWSAMPHAPSPDAQPRPALSTRA